MVGNFYDYFSQHKVALVRIDAGSRRACVLRFAEVIVVAANFYKMAAPEHEKAAGFKRGLLGWTYLTLVRLRF